jgi:hypothetical protein
LKVPVVVGVPLIVIVFEAHAAVTPAGNPVAVPIPVALVVVWIMLVIIVFTVIVIDEEEANPTVQAGEVGHGVQLSKANFFQRILITSR